MHLRYKVRPQLYETTDRNDTLFYKDDTASERVVNSFTRAVGQSGVSVAQGASENLSLGDLTDARGCYVEVSHDCVLRINGSTDDISLKVCGDSASDQTARIFLECTITQLTIEAPADQVITVKYAVWGDPA